MKLPWKSADDTAETPAAPSGDGKGRPTPKRRDAEKRNQRPLVGSKEEAKARKRRQREIAYERQRAALEGRGDERYLPVNDRGEHRRYIRDFIDARWSLSEFVMPIMLVMIFVMFLVPYLWKQAPIVARATPLYIFYGIFIVLIIEWVVYTVRVNRRLLAANGGDKSIKRGNGRYVVYRLTTPRRLRQPTPQVTRGQKVPLPTL